MEIGDPVEPEYVLAQIENEFLRNELLQGESLLKQLESNVERIGILSKQQVFENQRNIDLALVATTAARREAKRTEVSYDKQAISEFDFQKAMDELQSAEFSLNYATKFADLDKERIEFEQRAQQLEYEQQKLRVDESSRKVSELAIRSPIGGIVGSLLFEEKTFVNPGQAIIRVIDLTQFELEADVPESYAPELRLGIPAETHANSGLIIGKLVSIAPEVIGNQVEVQIRFADNPTKNCDRTNVFLLGSSWSIGKMYSKFHAVHL